jgi:nucleoside-triphosphatase THEP1
MGTPWLSSHISLKILLRSFIIVLTWYFLIGPILTEQLHGWLEKRQTQSKKEIEKVLQLLPATQNLVAQSWRLSANKKRWARIAAFSKMILVNALNPLIDQPVYILTGPIQTGKTTSLVSWSEKRNDVYGILTPVVNGQRVFMNAHLRQLFLMEAKEGEEEVLTVGRFTFSKNNFDKAIEIIREGIGNTGWLVIDEIGPMELRNQGFATVLKEVLAAANEKQKILLVVREGLTGKVAAYFDIHNSINLIDSSYLNTL